MRSWIFSKAFESIAVIVLSCSLMAVLIIAFFLVKVFTLLLHFLPENLIAVRARKGVAVVGLPSGVRGLSC